MTGRKPPPAPSDAWCSMCERTGVEVRKVAPTVGKYAGDGIHHVRLCPCCMEAIGRAWQEATTEVVGVSYEVRPHDGERGNTTIVSPTRGYALTMQQVRRDSGARLFKVTRRRRVKS